MAQKINGKYRVQTILPNTGKRTSAWFDHQDEADAFAAKLAGLRRDGKQGTKSRAEIQRALSKKAFPLAIGELFDAYATTVAPSTAKRVLGPVRARLAALGVLAEAPEAFTSARIQSLICALAETYAPATTRTTIRCLQACVRLAVPDFVQAVPWGRIRLPIVDDSPREACRSMAELEALADVSSGHDERKLMSATPRFSDAFARVVVLSLTGLRSGEACGLAWKHVFLAFPARIHVDRQVLAGEKSQEGPKFGPTKTRRARLLALHEGAVAALLQHLRLLKIHGFGTGAEDPVFPAADRGYRANGVIIERKLLRKLVKEAGFPNVARWSPHSLRHTFATLETGNAGGDLRAVQARTGHRSLASLSAYVHGLRELSPALAPCSPRLLALAGEFSATVDVLA